MEQYVTYYSIGGPDSTRDMVHDLNERIKKGWIIKSITNVYNGYNVVVLEATTKNVEIE